MGIVKDNGNNFRKARLVAAVALPGGGMFSFPIAGNWRLEGATPEQLNNVEVDDEGLHWPDIDENLSFAGLLLGDHGQYVKRRHFS